MANPRGDLEWMNTYAIQGPRSITPINAITANGFKKRIKYVLTSAHGTLIPAAIASLIKHIFPLGGGAEL